MACMGSRVFVLGGLGGESLNPAKPEDPTLIHVLDTSKFEIILNASGRSLALQNISSTQGPTVDLHKDLQLNLAASHPCLLRMLHQDSPARVLE